jgi:hypothetical protein
MITLLAAFLLATPVSCGLDQLDATQRQIAGEAYLTQDILPRKAANQVIHDAVEQCSGFETMTPAQITHAIDYAQSGAVLDLIEARLKAMQAPDGLIRTVWAGLDEDEHAIVLDFARGRSGGSVATNRSISQQIAKAKAGKETLDAVTMGLGALAIMQEMNTAH